MQIGTMAVGRAVIVIQTGVVGRWVRSMADTSEASIVIIGDKHTSTKQSSAAWRTDDGCVVSVVDTTHCSTQHSGALQLCGDAMATTLDPIGLHTISTENRTAEQQQQQKQLPYCIRDTAALPLDRVVCSVAGDNDCTPLT